MIEIQMPRLSDTMEEGTIATWQKAVGDEVRRGEVVAEIETDKAIMELEAYDDGFLAQILVQPGEAVAIGTPIGLLRGEGEAASAPAPAAQPSAEPAAEAAPAAAAEPAVSSQAPGAQTNGQATAAGRVKSSPLARKIAREAGLNIEEVVGSGPGGRIVRADVEAAAAAKKAAAPTIAAPAAAPAAPAPVPAPADNDFEEIPLSTMRKVAAKRLTESKQQAPHFYLTSAIDVTELVAFRATVTERLQAAGGQKISVNDLVVKAVATALRANPSLNVSYAGDHIRKFKRINLGVAVALESGLVVPVIKDADRKSVSEIAAASRDLAGRARDGKLRPDEMSGGTMTISNLGMFGIEHFAAVINPPEAAILAVGAATDEVRVRDGEFVARKIMRVTLSADHRAVDGAVGAVFLRQLTDLIEDPIRIIA